MKTAKTKPRHVSSAHDLQGLVIGTIFLLSGATSLVYQVAWMRLLSLFFGSDVYAAAITLSAFMGGLSLGSWLAGRFGDRVRRPLVLYGFLEFGIAAFAFVFPHLLAGFEDSYQSIYRSRFEAFPWMYNGFRLFVAALTMLLPTALMGATLPLMIRQFAGLAPELGKWVGFFYSVNTVGAFIGTLVAGFVLIPALGVSSTVLLAVLVNLTIGVGAIVMAFGLGVVDTSARERGLSRPIPIGGERRAVVLAMAISGMAALALEVVWMRILVQSFSATVYGFSIMLACFLFGIFYGSHKAAAIIDKHADPLRLLVTLELWLGGTVILLGIFTYLVPSLFGILVWGLTGVTGGAFGVSSIVAQFVVASLLIFGPTLMLGATFPVAVKIYTHDIDVRAQGTGNIYAANTAGAVLGALVGGFLLLPMIGARNSLIVIGAGFVLAAGILASSRRPQPVRILSQPKLVSALVVALVSTVAILLLPRQTVVNFNLQSSTSPDVLYHGEGVAHTVDLVRTVDGNTVMMINGNIEADTTMVQRRHFILKGHLPLLLHPNPADVAVVGLGLGITLAATERHPTVRNIRLVELSPQMVKAHSYITDVTGNVLRSPKINLRIDDGRNFMAMTEERFDMITADPVHPRITGVGYLYTREYYQDIRKRLRPGGVVTQWMPMYRISKESFDVAFRTFVSVFPNASFWYVRGHGLFVATMDDFAIDYENLAARFRRVEVRADLASIGIDSPEQLLGHLLMDANHIRGYLAQQDSDQLNTDDNAYLEYRTPFEFIERTESIVAELIPFSGWNVRGLLRNAPAGVAEAVQAQFDRRLAEILPELRKPIE